MITVILIILAIMFLIGAWSLEQPEGPRTIGEKLCEGLVLLIGSVFGLGAGLGAVCGAIVFLFVVLRIIYGLFQ